MSSKSGIFSIGCTFNIIDVFEIEFWMVYLIPISHDALVLNKVAIL